MLMLLTLLLPTVLAGEENILVEGNDLIEAVCPYRSILEKFRWYLLQQCPVVFDDKCDDQTVFDPRRVFKYRCLPGFPSSSKEYTVEVINASTMLSMLQYKDIYRRSWCMISLFYSPGCPFSARLAPYYNALTDMYAPVKIVAVDASEFSKLNSRYGISGTPTVMIWVNGVGIARMEDRPLNMDGLMAFIHEWTDLQLKFGVNHEKDGPLKIVQNDGPDMFYFSLSIVVVYAVIIYRLRERILMEARIRSVIDNFCRRLDNLREILDVPGH